jgi:hypothetical protein
VSAISDPEEGFYQAHRNSNVVTILTRYKKGDRIMKMKTSISSKVSLCGGIALALATIVWLPVTSRAAEPMKGGEHMLHLQGIKSQAEADALKPGDTMAMVCAKCKSVMIHNVTMQKGHVKSMTVGEKHLCPGCSSTIKVVGVGHGAHDEVKHVCEKCGEDSVFCCANKPGSGATEGMEKK